MTRMYIRSAEPTDAERIHQVTVASCRAAYEDVLEDYAFLKMVDDESLVEPLRTKLAETAADESLIYLVAQQDSSIVGFLQLLHHDRLPDHIDNDDAYLKSLYVHPTAWNEGIGTALLEERTRSTPGRSGPRPTRGSQRERYRQTVLSGSQFRADR